MLRHLTRAELEAEQAAILRRALLESDPTLPIRAGATAGGDRVRLRGLPVVGRGVGGHVPGTDPLGELLRREAQREPRGREHRRSC